VIDAIEDSNQIRASISQSAFQSVSIIHAFTNFTRIRFAHRGDEMRIGDCRFHEVHQVVKLKWTAGIKVREVETGARHRSGRKQTLITHVMDREYSRRPGECV